MSHWFFEGVIKHGTIVAVVALIFSVLAISSATQIPVQMIPDLEVRTITVETRWAGATPQDIEKEILIEQERYLRNVPNLQRMTATATSGSAAIELELPFGVDSTKSLIQVNNALSQVSNYPLNVDQPRIVATSFSSNAFMAFMVATAEGNPRNLDIDLLQDFIEDQIRPQMESVDGVSEVTLNGGAERQIQIAVDERALAQLGLGLTDLRDAIRARNRDISGGEVNAGKRRYLVRTVGRFDNLADLENLIISRQGDSIVRLGDIAIIGQDHSKIRQIASINGRKVILLQVRREDGSNVINIKNAMMKKVEFINRDILEPEGLVLELANDDTRYVEASIRNIWTNLMIGMALATLVMFFFLRSVKATLVGVIGIPLCTLAAFLGLLLADRTINVISMAGIAFAIGMTVDNSIVVLENIERYRRLGKGRLDSALQGVSEVWPAVLASTLTTILVFLPILFIEEEAGQLYSDVAIGITFAIIASMLVAITVIPALAARLDFKRSNTNSRADASDQSKRPEPRGWVRMLSNGSRWLSAGTLRRLITVVSTVFFSSMIIWFLTPPAEYLPEGEEPKIFAAMSAPPGYNLAEMEAIGEQLEAYLLPHVKADRQSFANGETDVPPLAFFLMRVSPDSIRIISETLEPNDISVLMDTLTGFYGQFPGMRAFAAKGSIISSNNGGTRSINLDISGPDLQSVYEAANKAYDRAGVIFNKPRIRTQPSTLTLAQPLVQIRPDWERVSELGIDAETIGFTVAALTEGAFVDDFFLDDDKLDIYLYSSVGKKPELNVIPGMLMRTGQGAMLPLSEIASIEQTVDTSTVRRVDSRRTVSLNVIPPDNIPLEAGVERVRSELVAYLRDNGELPASVNIDISGASDQLDATRQALSINFVIAIAIVYLLLVAIFSHWGYPLLIMTAIPLGVAGGIVGLAAMNWVGGLLPLMGLQPLSQPFDMITMLGFLILMGTVVNNPILIVEQARKILADGVTTAQDAVAQAVELRLRPIAMTTLTTICGLAPLVFIPGEGTELYRGVGAIVLFGLLGTAIVTLTFLPSFMVMVLKLQGRNSNWNPLL